MTTYEWRTGSKPVRIQEDFVVIDTKDEDDGIQETDDVSEIYIPICPYQIEHRTRNKLFDCKIVIYLSRDTRFSTMWHFDMNRLRQASEASI